MIKALVTCVGRDQETAPKTDSIAFPRPHAAVWLQSPVPKKSGAALVTTNTYGPKCSPGEMLSLSGRSATQGETPMPEPEVLLMCIYSSTWDRLYEINTEKSGWHLVKI